MEHLFNGHMTQKIEPALPSGCSDNRLLLHAFLVKQMKSVSLLFLDLFAGPCQFSICDISFFIEATVDASMNLESRVFLNTFFI